jgi:hypothetical protein
MYNTLKQEISTNNSKFDSINISAGMAENLDAADLLIYRGEKYKENKLKLKEKLSHKEFEQCTFKPELNQRSINISNKFKKTKLPQSSIEKIKHRMNGALVKYMSPVEIPKLHVRISELDSQIPRIQIPVDNNQQSTLNYNAESERHQVEEEKLEIYEQPGGHTQRISTEESEPRSLTRYLQNKMYFNTESSQSNSGDLAHSPVYEDAQGKFATFD